MKGRKEGRARERTLDLLMAPRSDRLWAMPSGLPLALRSDLLWAMPSGLPLPLLSVLR